MDHGDGHTAQGQTEPEEVREQIGEKELLRIDKRARHQRGARDETDSQRTSLNPVEEGSQRRVH